MCIRDRVCTNKRSLQGRHIMNITNIGLVGAGTMGSGISQICALKGYHVTMQDISEPLLEGGLAVISKSLGRLLDREKISSEEKDASIGRISTTTDLAMMSECYLVIEAATEDMDLKTVIFEKLNVICGPTTILASNTSSLSLTSLASSSGRPERVIGMHFFNPVPMMALVEVIRALQTSDETFNATDEFIRSLDKTPVSVKDSPGFVVNRMLVPMINEAAFILYEGLATAEVRVAGRLATGAGTPFSWGATGSTSTS